MAEEAESLREVLGSHCAVGSPASGLRRPAGSRRGCGEERVPRPVPDTGLLPGSSSPRSTQALERNGCKFSFACNWYTPRLVTRFLLAVDRQPSQVKIGSRKWNALEFHFTSEFHTLSGVMLWGLLWRLLPSYKEVFWGLQASLLHNPPNWAFLRGNGKERRGALYPSRERRGAATDLQKNVLLWRRPLPRALSSCLLIRR